MNGWKEMKMSPSWEDHRVGSVWRRISSLARRHQPFVAFLLFATFIILCTQLPWTGADRGYSSSKFLPPANGTLGPGNGTQVYLPPENFTSKPKFAKVTVASGFEDIVYEKALATHWEHAERHGYPMYLARENAVEGMFNKIAYLMDVLLHEMYKPVDDRIEWLFWFDADSIIMNQLLPLEVFIPPNDFKHINWLAAKDFNGLNAGVFIIRVCPWTLDLLTRTMTYKHYHPDEDYTFEEQSILARLTEKDSDFKDQSTFVPKNWFNAYFYFLNEVKPGLLLSHFPHPDYKWHIYEWLRVLDADKDKAYKPVYNRPVQDTNYPEEIRNFWNVKRRAEKALKGFQRNVNRGADPIKFGLEHDETKELAVEFRNKLEALKEAATYKVDDPKQLEKMVVETEEVNAQLISKLMAYYETHDNPPPVAGF